MNSGKKSTIVLKEDLIENQSTIENIQKTKIKSYGDDFHDKEMLKVGSHDVCLALILNDFVLK